MQPLTKILLFSARAQAIRVNVYVTLFFYLTVVFVLKLRESFLKSLKIILIKIVKSILRCRKTINSPKNSFRKK